MPARSRLFGKWIAAWLVGISLTLVAALVFGAYEVGVQRGAAELAELVDGADQGLREQRETAQSQPVLPTPTALPGLVLPTDNPFSEDVLRSQRPLVQPLRPPQAETAPSSLPLREVEQSFADGPEAVMPPHILDGTQTPHPPAPLPQAQAEAVRPVAELPVTHPSVPEPPVSAAGAPAPLVTGDAAPWLANAVPTRLPLLRPAVAVIIDDMGVDRKRSVAITALSAPLTLAYLPYGAGIAQQAAKARALGHELMVHMPMEPLASGTNPGPQALLTSLDPDELAARLAHNLSQFDGYVGVNNHMGSRFTESAPLMRPVLVELKRRGLFFLDSRTTARSVADELGALVNLPHTGRDVFLDHDISRAAVDAALAQLERIARKNGTAIAIGHPHDVTRQALIDWLPTLAAKGIDLVPVSAIVRTRWQPRADSLAQGQ